MNLLRTVFVFTMVAVTMFLVMIPAVLLFILRLLGARKLVSILVYRIAQGWARAMLFLTGCDITVTGRENIPRQGGVCFVSNHGSILDIVLLLAYAGRPIGFIAKKELVAVPLLNIWILLLGGLFLDRKDVRKAVRTIEEGVRRIRDGGGMIIFPEGHRSRGEGLLPFHQGSFRLATQAEAPIVPVAIKGSYEVFEMTGRIRNLSVSIAFLPVISIADMPTEHRRQQAADRTREAIAGALQTMTLNDRA